MNAQERQQTPEMVGTKKPYDIKKIIRNRNLQKYFPQ